MRNGGSGRLRSAFRLSLLRSWILLFVSGNHLKYPFFQFIVVLSLMAYGIRVVSLIQSRRTLLRKPLYFLLKTPNLADTFP